MLLILTDSEPNTVSKILRSWPGYYWKEERIVSPFVYAHLAYKIAELCELIYTPGVQPDQRFQPAVEFKVGFIILNFVKRNFMLNGKEEEMAARIKETVLEKHAARLSVFGLVHCFHLLEGKQEPFQKTRLFGADLQGINEAIQTYIDYCRVKFKDFEREVEVTTQLKIPKKNHAVLSSVWQKHEELMNSLPAPSGNWFDQMREKRRK